MTIRTIAGTVGISFLVLSCSGVTGEPDRVSRASCISGNRHIDSLDAVSPGVVNARGSMGVVPGRRGVVSSGRKTPVGFYAKSLWILRDPTPPNDIEIVGHSVATGKPVRWAYVRADNVVVPHRRLTGGGPLEDDWVVISSAVLYPGRGCYEFVAILSSGAEFGRLRTFYDPVN